MSEKLVYFAFGSNMHTPRLQQRVPSANPIGKAFLPERELAFRKQGVDGSAKCDAKWTGNAADQLPGVLFEIDANDLASLDAAEGAGNPFAAHYERIWVVVTREGGAEVEALTYQAEEEAIKEGLFPTPEYHGHVLRGAIEHALPEWHIEAIRQITCHKPTLRSG
ncbi:gamma-glutamylcyclotransferase family protein [Halorhodospira halochloris]|uniref:gamma-glutamylcyclotransferase family protein n=1 Tax=Halorhodospira halochloris TaxID=1052 RepID=UPI001EE84CFE|nr:gamma-glutamylcyclotransferase family protein [Halorhodospira halochloris]MCG5549439.1 gamma-glutamylcyclotransferase [Halorhodospira halochloris]